MGSDAEFKQHFTTWLSVLGMPERTRVAKFFDAMAQAGLVLVRSTPAGPQSVQLTAQAKKKPFNPNRPYTPVAVAAATAATSPSASAAPVASAGSRTVSVSVAPTSVPAPATLAQVAPAQQPVSRPALPTLSATELALSVVRDHCRVIFLRLDPSSAGISFSTLGADTEFQTSLPAWLLLLGMVAKMSVSQWCRLLQTQGVVVVCGSEQNAQQQVVRLVPQAHFPAGVTSVGAKPAPGAKAAAASAKTVPAKAVPVKPTPALVAPAKPAPAEAIPVTTAAQLVPAKIAPAQPAPAAAASKPVPTAAAAKPAPAAAAAKPAPASVAVAKPVPAQPAPAAAATPKVAPAAAAPKVAPAAVAATKPAPVTASAKVVPAQPALASVAAAAPVALKRKSTELGGQPDAPRAATPAQVPPVALPLPVRASALPLVPSAKRPKPSEPVVHDPPQRPEFVFAPTDDLTCWQCRRSFDSLEGVAAHYVSSRHWAIPPADRRDVSPLTCWECGASFGSSAECLDHQAVAEHAHSQRDYSLCRAGHKYPAAAPHECWECRQTFGSAAACLDHQLDARHASDQQEYLMHRQASQRPPASTSPGAQAAATGEPAAPASLVAPEDVKAERARQLRDVLMQKRRADPLAPLTKPESTPTSAAACVPVGASVAAPGGDVTMAEAAPVAAAPQPLSYSTALAGLGGTAGLGAAVAGAHQALSALLQLLHQSGQAPSGGAPAAPGIDTSGFAGVLTSSLVSALAAFTPASLAPQPPANMPTSAANIAPVAALRVPTPTPDPGHVPVPAVVVAPPPPPPPPLADVAIAAPAKVSSLALPVPALVTPVPVADSSVRPMHPSASLGAARSAAAASEDLAALLAEASEAVLLATTRK